MDFPVFALSPNVFLCTSLVLERLTYCKRESSSESKRLKWRSGQKVQKVQYDKFCQSLKSMCGLWTILLLLCFAGCFMTFCGRFLKQLHLFSVVGTQCWYWDGCPQLCCSLLFLKSQNQSKLYTPTRDSKRQRHGTQGTNGVVIVYCRIVKGALLESSYWLWPIFSAL